MTKMSLNPSQKPPPSPYNKSIILNLSKSPNGITGTELLDRCIPKTYYTWLNIKEEKAAIMDALIDLLKKKVAKRVTIGGRQGFALNRKSDNEGNGGVKQNGESPRSAKDAEDARDNRESANANARQEEIEPTVTEKEPAIFAKEDDAIKEQRPNDPMTIDGSMGNTMGPEPATETRRDDTVNDQQSTIIPKTIDTPEDNTEVLKASISTARNELEKQRDNVTTDTPERSANEPEFSIPAEVEEVIHEERPITPTTIEQPEQSSTQPEYSNAMETSIIEEQLSREMQENQLQRTIGLEPSPEPKLHGMNIDEVVGSDIRKGDGDQELSDQIVSNMFKGDIHEDQQMQENQMQGTMIREPSPEPTLNVLNVVDVAHQCGNRTSNEASKPNDGPKASNALIGASYEDRELLENQAPRAITREPSPQHKLNPLNIADVAQSNTVTDHGTRELDGREPSNAFKGKDKENLTQSTVGGAASPSVIIDAICVSGEQSTSFVKPSARPSRAEPDNGEHDMAENNIPSTAKAETMINVAESEILMDVVNQEDFAVDGNKTSSTPRIDIAVNMTEPENLMDLDNKKDSGVNGIEPSVVSNDQETASGSKGDVAMPDTEEVVSSEQEAAISEELNTGTGSRPSPTTNFEQVELEHNVVDRGLSVKADERAIGIQARERQTLQPIQEQGNFRPLQETSAILRSENIMHTNEEGLTPRITAEQQHPMGMQENLISPSRGSAQYGMREKLALATSSKFALSANTRLDPISRGQGPNVVRTKEPVAYQTSEAGLVTNPASTITLARYMDTSDKENQIPGQQSVSDNGETSKASKGKDIDFGNQNHDPLQRIPEERQRRRITQEWADIDDFITPQKETVTPNDDGGESEEDTQMDDVDDEDDDTQENLFDLRQHGEAYAEAWLHKRLCTPLSESRRRSAPTDLCRSSYKIPDPNILYPNTNLDNVRLKIEQKKNAPKWLMEGLDKLRQKYPDALIEPEGEIMKCLDCDDKTFKPSGKRSITNFENHLKSKSHKVNVEQRLEKQRQTNIFMPTTDSSIDFNLQAQQPIQVFAVQDGGRSDIMTGMKIIMGGMEKEKYQHSVQLHGLQSQYLDLNKKYTAQVEHTTEILDSARRSDEKFKEIHENHIAFTAKQSKELSEVESRLSRQDVRVTDKLTVMEKRVGKFEESREEMDKHLRALDNDVQKINQQMQDENKENANCIKENTGLIKEHANRISRHERRNRERFEQIRGTIDALKETSEGKLNQLSENMSVSDERFEQLCGTIDTLKETSKAELGRLTDRMSTSEKARTGESNDLNGRLDAVERIRRKDVVQIFARIDTIEKGRKEDLEAQSARIEAAERAISGDFEKLSDHITSAEQTTKDQHGELLGRVKQLEGLTESLQAQNKDLKSEIRRRKESEKSLREKFNVEWAAYAATTERRFQEFEQKAEARFSQLEAESRRDAAKIKKLEKKDVKKDETIEKLRSFMGAVYEDGVALRECVQEFLSDIQPENDEEESAEQKAEI
ncbi:hypothetical protein G7Y89_g10035 [Cudoniella acicularis]|uniref:Uncharacterized protein n=1 Tax=Cudoniella acicularis TaxID=354080 RepID=A0A8H4VZF9_9HELO|nr:hypothetical protein G7Y89_g10035 [Cudoniella acicularis]